MCELGVGGGVCWPAASLHASTNPSRNQSGAFGPASCSTSACRNSWRNGISQKLPRGQRAQGLRADPISLGEGRHPAGRQCGLAKVGRGGEGADGKRSGGTQAGSFGRFSPRAIESGQKCRVAGVERFQNESIAGEALPVASRCLVRGLRGGKILGKNFARSAALCSHCRGALLAKAHAVSPAAPVKGEAIALAADFKPGAGNLVPSQRLAHGELEIFGGDFGAVELQGDGTPRSAAPRDGQILPAGLREAMRGEGRSSNRNA